jgi:hypothetical protein
LFGPRTYTFYKTDRQPKDGHFPDYAVMNGQLRCAGFHLTVNDYEPPGKTFEMPFISFSYQVDGALCKRAENPSTESKFIRNYSTFAPHFDISCWHKWLPLLNLANITQVAGLCTHMCLSPHRFQNGVQDCIDSMLDETTFDPSIKHPKSHCLNCISHKGQSICLPTSEIDFSPSECVHEEDMYITGGSVAIKDVKCTNYDASECHIIRDHISRSSSDKENVIAITPNETLFGILPFGQYCDTYFDIDTSIDESVEHCFNKWICARNEYRCKTGQCIPFDWLCDGKNHSVICCSIFH